jgi:hypothetical protein
MTAELVSKPQSEVQKKQEEDCERAEHAAEHHV